MKKYTGFTICLTFNIWKPFLFVMFVLFFRTKDTILVILNSTKAKEDKALPKIKVQSNVYTVSL